MDKIKVTKLSSAIAAEIIGINFSKKLSKEYLEIIYNLLIENKVIFFLEQQMSPSMHINIAKSFGEIEPPHPVYPQVENIICLLIFTN